MRQSFILYKSLIGSVKQDNRTLSICKIHPCLKLITAENRTGRIVRRTDVEEIRFDVLPRFRQESVFLSGSQANDFSPRHHVSVHISRIRRFDDQSAAFPVEQIEDIAEFITGSAGYEDFVGRKHDPPSLIIAGDRLPQKRRSAFRHIAVKTFRRRLIIDGLM